MVPPTLGLRGEIIALGFDGSRSPRRGNHRERRLRQRWIFLRRDLRDDPRWKLNRLNIVRPRVAALHAVVVDNRRVHEDVPTSSARVAVRVQRVLCPLAGVGQLLDPLGVAVDVVPPARTRACNPRERQARHHVGGGGVNVDDVQPAGCTSGNGHVGRGRARPPFPDLRLVGGGVAASTAVVEGDFRQR